MKGYFSLSSQNMTEQTYEPPLLNNKMPFFPAMIFKLIISAWIPSPQTC